MGLYGIDGREGVYIIECIEQKVGADLAFQALEFCFRAFEFCFAACHFRVVPPCAQSHGESAAQRESEIDDVAEEKEEFEARGVRRPGDRQKSLGIGSHTQCLRYELEDHERVHHLIKSG